VVTAGSGPSRRGLLRTAGATFAGAGALLAAGCGSNGAKATTTATTSVAPELQARDITILADALELERRTVAAYVAGIPLLNKPDGKLATQFLSEELAHTGELIGLIRNAGGMARPRANSYDIGSAHDAAGVLAILQALEQLQIAYYLRSIPVLATTDARAGVATILAADAQHVVAVRQSRGQPAITSALTP
jgi:hypothetical protein